LELSENPTRFLSTVQIGITLIGILLGMYSGEALTKGFETFLLKIPYIQIYAHNLAVGGVLLFTTYLSIVLGELFPKRLGLTFPEPIAMSLARPMQLLSIATAPFVWLLTTTNSLLLKLLGIKSTIESKVSEEEIKSIIKDSAEGGEIQEIEQDLVERVFEMGDRKVKSLMTHRNELVYFNEGDTLENIRTQIAAEKHSAYPVCQEDDLDSIVGIVLLKDLFTPRIEDAFSLKDYLRKPIFVNNHASGYRLLETFKKEKMHYAIVVDEFGSTKGMVTLDDLVDALVGDVSIADEYEITQRAKNSWLIDGQYPILEFLKYFNLQQDRYMSHEYMTVAGLFISKYKGLPIVGNKVQLENYELEVIDKDGQRIDKILITRQDALETPS
jgi:putative hemolysin